MHRETTADCLRLSTKETKVWYAIETVKNADAHVPSCMRKATRTNVGLEVRCQAKQQGNGPCIVQAGPIHMHNDQRLQR